MKVCAHADVEGNKMLLNGVAKIIPSKSWWRICRKWASAYGSSSFNYEQIVEQWLEKFLRGETLEYSLDFDKIKYIASSINAWVINNTKMKNVKPTIWFLFSNSWRHCLHLLTHHPRVCNFHQGSFLIQHPCGQFWVDKRNWHI